jgi:hypothetical protein
MPKVVRMSVGLMKTYPRLWSLESGIAMVVTDLHGDWDAYQRYRDRFVDLLANGQVDWLIFTGDLIHSESTTEPDKSVEIVLDVLALQSAYGLAAIYLCGNHEMPHIYGISLGKGKKEYTSAFEATLSRSQRRAEVVTLFDSLPFYIRTRSGVSLAHAGADPVMTDHENMSKILNWCHKDLLDSADKILAEEDVVALRRAYRKLNLASSYDDLARHYLAVSGPDDPRYDHLLRGFLATATSSFEFLWSVLFTRCEEAYGQTDYAIFLDAMLKELSVNFFPQQVLVAGHMAVPGGHKIVAQRHLRLASAGHARPREAGQYLVFDTARPILTVDDLLAGLESVY